jgi:ElaB/YqjD/DUF883 family membrane-anchored ribosome-binding protein
MDDPTRIEDISAGLNNLIGEAESLLQSLADGTDRHLDSADVKARDTLHRICGHLRNARAEVLDGAKRIDGAVHSHPWQALAASAIVGFLAGLLVRRR